MLKFPAFRPNQYEQGWVDSELETARIVRALWTSTPKNQRTNPEFLAVLTRFGWINQSQGDGESTRLWHNRHLAHWLKTDPSDEIALAQALASRTNLLVAQARRVINTSAGITLYHTPLRPGALRAIRRHADKIHEAFNDVSERSTDVIKKVGQVATMLFELPTFKAPRGRGSLVNALTPVVACLDPQRRFPIMNQRTKKLMREYGIKNDPEGAMALARLIGQYNLRHAFDLDVYASSDKRKTPGARKRSRVRAQRPVGWKDEEDGYAILSKQKIRIRRIHNALVNRFARAVEWKFRMLESDFDVVLEEWRGNRKLLVEAKTGTDGPAGRAQLRQAIGQLHDYRWRAFPSDAKSVDLALLVPSRPDKKDIDLLKSVHIETLWFDKKALRGTISL
jgi:hypothetical protein